MAALLAGTQYDPAAAVTKSTTALLALTAIDTTNLRLTFTVPANGKVLVRISTTFHGSTTFPQVLLGVLQSSTVIARVSPIGALNNTSVATAMMTLDAVFVVSGLTAGASLTWDAAYGVEIVSGAGGLKYGGPNDTTGDNAFGGISFSVWDASSCLSGILYDPAAAVTKSTTALLALTALDTTNLRATVTVPTNGILGVRLVGTVHGATTFPSILLGVLDSTTVRGRLSPNGGIKGGALATTHVTQEAWFLITGLTGGASITLDAAYGVETILASTGIKYGGPNNTTTNDAFGAFQFEIWDVT